MFSYWGELDRHYFNNRKILLKIILTWGVPLHNDHKLFYEQMFKYICKIWTITQIFYYVYYLKSSLLMDK